MSTSRCGNICVIPPKCYRKERRCGFSNAVVLMQPCQGDAVFLGENKSTLFGLLTVDAFRNHWLRLVYNRTAQPKCSNLCNAFYGRQFCEPSRVQGWLCTKVISRIFKKKSSIPTLLWQSGASESATVSCHDLGGGCLAFVVLEHMAFCFDSSPCAPLSSRSCSAHLVILFANSPFPPALYSILIISSFQNALVSAFFFCQSVSICSAAPIICLLLY